MVFNRATTKLPCHARRLDYESEGKQLGRNKISPTVSSYGGGIDFVCIGF